MLLSEKTTLELGTLEFDENIYVIDTTKRARSNVLQEEDDKSLSLGMPMQPQEEDNEEQEDDEQLEIEERKHPPSPPMDEGNTQNLVHDKLCFYDSDDEEEYESMPNENIIDNDFKKDEEYDLDMLYDKIGRASCRERVYVLV